MDERSDDGKKEGKGREGKEGREGNEPKDLVNHGRDHHFLNVSSEGVACHDEAERERERETASGRSEGKSVEKKMRVDDETRKREVEKETHTIAGTKFLFPSTKEMKTPKAPPAHQRRPRAVCWRSEFLFRKGRKRRS